MLADIRLELIFLTVIYYRRLGQVALQDTINDWSFKRFKAYFEQYNAFYPNTSMYVG